MKPKRPRKPKGLAHYFTTVFFPVRLATKHKLTAYQYTLNLKRFDEFLGRQALLTDLNDATIMLAIAWCRKQGLAPGSVEKFRDNLVCISRVLFRKRIVDTEVDIPPIHVPKAIPIAFTREQLNRLWEYLELLPGEIGGVSASLWFRAIVCCFWDSGARAGEIFGLRWSDVDLQRGFILCRAATVKANKQDRLYRLDPETVALLRKIILPQRELVFAWPFCEGTLYNTWRGILKRAGLPTGPRYMFHCLRKSVASHLQAAGVSAQFAMGHSDPRQTNEVYLDPRIAKPPAACDSLFRMSDYRKSKPENDDEPRTDIG